MKRPIVCGGRAFGNRAYVFNKLDAAHESFGPFEVVIHGGAGKTDDDGNVECGADLLAGEWAEERLIPVVEKKANWKALGRRAGPIRNQQMIDEHDPDCVIAFEGGVGTEDMVRRARAHGLPVFRASL